MRRVQELHSRQSRDTLVRDTVPSLHSMLHSRPVVPPQIRMTFITVVHLLSSYTKLASVHSTTERTLGTQIKTVHRDVVPAPAHVARRSAPAQRSKLPCDVRCWAICSVRSATFASRVLARQPRAVSTTAFMIASSACLQRGKLGHLGGRVLGRLEEGGDRGELGGDGAEARTRGEPQLALVRCPSLRREV